MQVDGPYRMSHINQTITSDDFEYVDHYPICYYHNVQIVKLKDEIFIRTPLAEFGPFSSVDRAIAFLTRRLEEELSVIRPRLIGVSAMTIGYMEGVVLCALLAITCLPDLLVIRMFALVAAFFQLQLMGLYYVPYEQLIRRAYALYDRTIAIFDTSGTDDYYDEP